jgi:hypothetical protein
VNINPLLKAHSSGLVTLHCIVNVMNDAAGLRLLGMLLVYLILINFATAVKVKLSIPMKFYCQAILTLSSGLGVRINGGIVDAFQT